MKCFGWPMMAGPHRPQGILRKTVPLCGDQDPICPNSIFLDAEKTTTFGRTSSSETNVRLLSSKTPLMISRKHASIAFKDGVWTILDHNSLNGVFVNGQQIPANVPQEIKPGDCICFGVAIENNVHEFDYTFEVASSTRKRKVDWNESLDKDTRVCKVLKESVNKGNEAGPSGENLVAKRENVYKKINVCKIQESEKKIEGLTLLLAEKEKAYQQQLEQKEKDLAGQLLRQKEDLEIEKKEQEKCLMMLLQGKLHEKETELSNQLEQQKAILLAEKETVENNLVCELNTKLEEKDKELTAQLEAQRDKLEGILQSKIDEQKTLQDELNKNKIEREKLLDLQENEKKLAESLERLREELNEKQELLAKQQDITRKAEEMAKKILVEQMEDEFTCIICHELFIQATTLQCSHSYCKYCLVSWLKKKKLCPICRSNTNGTFVRSIVLDSAVEKIVETMDDETKKRRQVIKEERKKLDQEVTLIKDSPPGTQSGTGNQGNPIVVNAGFLGNDVQIIERRPGLPVHVPQPVLPGVITLPGPANVQEIRRPRRGGQGNPGNQHRGRHGNGHCFVCGMRGHWARTCPFR